MTSGIRTTQRGAIAVAVAVALVAVAAALVGCSGDGDDGRTRAVAPASTPTLASTPTSTPTTVPEAVRPRGRFERAMCEQRPYSVEDVRGGWVHPSENFYFPGEEPPSDKDLRHLIVNDNAVLVEYRADLRENAREALRGWVAWATAAIAVPEYAADAPALRAFLTDRELSCDGVDLKQLDAFAARRRLGAPVPHGDAG